MIPVLFNPQAGGADRARAAIERDSRFDLRELEPARIAEVVRHEALHDTPRLVVCGGDGTLSSAFGAAAGTALEIGVFPGGTLNHFARDYGIPLDDPAAALDLALSGAAQPVDLASVNGHPMLNTSSVGVYVEFVRRRELLERWFRYRLASVGAAFAVWRHPKALSVVLRTGDGVQHSLHTPLLFVGVQERVLTRGGALGVRRAGGIRGLHILVVNEHTPLRIHKLAFRAAVRGIDALITDNEIASYLTSGAAVTASWQTGTIAVDGELVQVNSRLKYDYVRDAVKVVRP